MSETTDLSRRRLSPRQALAVLWVVVERSDRSCTMGVDTGRELHVVISRRKDPSGGEVKREIILIGAAQSYEELDSYIKRLRVSRCVIDALPEIRGGCGSATSTRTRRVR